MVKLTSVALAVAGVVALGSTGVVSSSEGGRARSSDTFRSADDLIVHNTMRGSKPPVPDVPDVPDMVSHSHMDTMDRHEGAGGASSDNRAVEQGDPLGRDALLALKTPSNGGCAKFETAGVTQDVPFFREQCLDEHGLTYFTRKEMILADSIKNEADSIMDDHKFDVLSREALVNHRVNQVDSCKQLLRTGRHMRSVYKFGEMGILQARVGHMSEIDPLGDDTEEEEEQRDEAINIFNEHLAAFKEEQLRPYMEPMSTLGDTCMYDLMLLNGQHCAGRAQTFIRTHGPRLKDDVEVYITSSRRSTRLMDALNMLSITSNAVCPPRSRGTF